MFKGRVRSDKPPCAGGREVKLRNTTQPGALSVEEARSNGKYEFSISDEAVPGKFFTTTAKVERPAYTCAAGKSGKVSPG